MPGKDMADGVTGEGGSSAEGRARAVGEEAAYQIERVKLTNGPCAAE